MCRPDRGRVDPCSQRRRIPSIIPPFPRVSRRRVAQRTEVNPSPPGYHSFLASLAVQPHPRGRPSPPAPRDGSSGNADRPSRGLPSYYIYAAARGGGGLWQLALCTCFSDRGTIFDYLSAILCDFCGTVLNVRSCAGFQVCPLRAACVPGECTTCRVRPISVRECQSWPMGFRDADPFTDANEEVSGVVARGTQSGTLNRLVDGLLILVLFCYNTPAGCAVMMHRKPIVEE